MPSVDPTSAHYAVLSILLASTLFAPSCTDDRSTPDDDCFPWDPWVDERASAAEYAESEDFRPDEYDIMLRAIGFCEYEPEELDEIFPEHELANLDFSYHCVETSTCEQCVGEDIDEAIRKSYSARQDMHGCPADGRAVIAYDRGCVTFVDEADGRPRCCYSAAIVSECPLGSIPMP